MINLVLSLIFMLAGPFACIATVREIPLKAEPLKAALAKKTRPNLLLYIGMPIAYLALYLLRGGDWTPFVLFQNCLLIWFTAAAACRDWLDKTIPNRLVLAMMAAWAITTLPFLATSPSTLLARLSGSLLGFALGGGIFLLVYFLSKKGLGGGDVKLVAAIGLYTTAQRILPVIFYGSLAAALAGVALIIAKKKSRKDTFALAPFLLLGLLLTLYFL